MLFGFGSNYYHAMGGSFPTRLVVDDNKKKNVSARILHTPDDDDIVQVACTTTATVYVTKSGKVHQVGTMHGCIHKVPTRILVELPLKVVQVAAGRHFCVAKLEGGVAVVSWGAGHFGQLGHGPNICSLSKPRVMEHLLPHTTGSPISQVAVGSWHGLALTTSGRIFAWGSNRRWQCGIKRNNNNNNKDSSRPTLVYPQPITDVDVVFTKITCGKSHSVGLARGGKVYTWGASHVGQCGHNTRRATIAPPRLVEALAKVVVVDIAAGDSHTLALTGGGRVFGWGSGLEGQLGVGVAVPISRPKLVDDLDFVAICAQQEAKLKQQQQEKQQALEQEDGPLLTDLCGGGGIHTEQQNAIEQKSLQAQKSPHQLSMVPKIVSVVAAGSYSVALNSSGHAYVWGYNDAGVLGVTPTTNELPYCEPLLVSNPQQQERYLETRTFDSRHNVLLPRRVDALRKYKIVQAAGGPSHLVFCCEARIQQEQTVGRTLYEVQHNQNVLVEQVIVHDEVDDVQQQQQVVQQTQEVEVVERLDEDDDSEEEEDENDSDEKVVEENGKFTEVAQSEPPPKPLHKSHHKKRITRLIMKRLSSSSKATTTASRASSAASSDEVSKRKGARQVLSQVFCKSER